MKHALMILAAFPLLSCPASVPDPCKTQALIDALAPAAQCQVCGINCPSPSPTVSPSPGAPPTLVPSATPATTVLPAPSPAPSITPPPGPTLVPVSPSPTPVPLPTNPPVATLYPGLGTRPRPYYPPIQGHCKEDGFEVRQMSLGPLCLPIANPTPDQMVSPGVGPMMQCAFGKDKRSDWVPFLDGFGLPASAGTSDSLCFVWQGSKLAQLPGQNNRSCPATWHSEGATLTDAGQCVPDTGVGPSPVPTPTIAPSPVGVLACSTKPKPDACLYVWSTGNNCTGPYRDRSGLLKADCDSTPRFKSACGSGPCNGDHDNCCGQECEDARGPIWSVTGAVNWGVDDTNPFRVIIWGNDGDKITIKSCPRKDLRDWAGYPLGVCGGVSDPCKSVVVEMKEKAPQ